MPTTARRLTKLTPHPRSSSHYLPLAASKRAVEEQRSTSRPPRARNTPSRSPRRHHHHHGHPQQKPYPNSPPKPARRMPIATALSRFSPLAPLRRRRQSPRQSSSSSETGDSLDEKSPSPLSGNERSYEMRTISARKARVLLPQQQQKKQRPSALATAQTGGEAERVWKEFWI